MDSLHTHFVSSSGWNRHSSSSSSKYIVGRRLPFPFTTAMTTTASPYSATIPMTKSSPFCAPRPPANATNLISPCSRKCAPTSNHGGNRHLCQQLQQRLASSSGTTLIKIGGCHFPMTNFSAWHQTPMGGLIPPRELECK
jgi:hypothetical protein